jgi:hypothetical protein
MPENKRKSWTHWKKHMARERDFQHAKFLHDIKLKISDFYFLK